MRLPHGKVLVSLPVALAFTLATAGVVSAFSVIESSAFSGVVTSFPLSDYPGALSCAGFSALILWGDATPASPATSIAAGSAGRCDVSGTHTYVEDGTYSVDATVTDGFTVNDYLATATVQEAVLSMTALAGSATEGTPFTAVVAQFSDPGSPDPGSDFTATIDWGDGTTSAGTLTATGGGIYDISGSHTYADEGSFSVQTTAAETNELDFSVSAANTFAVAEADSLTGTGVSSGAQAGFAFTNIVATFTDTFTGNVAADFTALIDWGDASSSAGTVIGSAGNYTVSGTHTYAAPGTYTVSTTLTDDAPGTATATTVSTITVAPADVTISMTHTGDFKQLIPASYWITVKNVSAGQTVGTVTVHDTLPTGVFPLSLSGTGWTCHTATRTCTRSDPLAPGASYPQIRVKVVVGLFTPIHVANQATVSGGGDVTAANDTASDPTTIQKWIF